MPATHDALCLRRIGHDAHELHQAYFAFLERVFPGADFRLWSSRGGWECGYFAHAWFAGDEVVANIGVSETTLVVGGQRVLAWQLGGVGVLPEYRNKGLARTLMDCVLSQANELERRVFLFANDTALDLYPRFGFRRLRESIFRARAPVAVPILPMSGARMRRLDLAAAADRALLQKLSTTAAPLCNHFSVIDYYSSLLWHGCNDKRDSFYYAPKCEAILVASQQGCELFLLDIIAPAHFDARPCVEQLADGTLNAIEFGFAPHDWWPGEIEVLQDPRSELFVLGDFGCDATSFRIAPLAHT